MGDRGDVVGHEFDLCVGEDEVAAPWAHDHLDVGLLDRRGDGADQPDARRGPALGQVGAQLDPIGAAHVGDRRSLEIVDADLDENGAGDPHAFCVRRRRRCQTITATRAIARTARADPSPNQVATFW